MAEIPRVLLLEANREHWTRGMVRPNDQGIARAPIVCDREVVSFYTPRIAATGEMRIGPVYVRPPWRRRGLVLAVYAAIQGPMLACIEAGNTASQCLHEKAGLHRSRRYANGWWWRRDA